MEEDFLRPIEVVTALVAGQVLRRISPDRVIQGGVRGLTEAGDGAIVAEVVNLHTPSFVAEAGIVRPGSEDRLFVLEDSFSGRTEDAPALQIVREWVLFREHRSLQSAILDFVRTSYSPRHLLHLKRNELLAQLFVPVQERFKIGKFQETVDWEAVGAKRFLDLLNSLDDGKHITYVAFIPKETSGQPRFYSIGTKPHLETLASLKREPFAFRPNHGGHIKIVSAQGEEPRRFVVDAGSNDLGSGMHTALAVANLVTEALREAYPGPEYTPLAGRGAHGLHQSY